MKVRAHVFVNGRVQGVFFRSQTQRRAESVDVKGWVSNLPDGRVEAVFEGEEEAVNAMIKFCEQGPRGAYVTNVDVKWEEFTGEFRDFKIKF
ncbi:acylphosphatase [Candidatus Bathyarchaeota archaeon A05DMB-2]|nr:acylphosphatase [Candidatus Bathyarchaeota archaeon A05DMB-2]